MKSILVTGSSSGIGAAICEHFSQIGWKVFGSVRNQYDGDKLTDICGENFIPLIFDVTDINAINSIRGANPTQQQELWGYIMGEAKL